MSIKIIIITLIITILIASGLYAKSNEVYFKFEVGEKTDLNDLTKIVSIDNVKEKTVYAYANQKEFKEFLTLDIDYEILPHPGTLHIPDMATSKEQMRAWDEYPTYETYVSMMNDFQTDYPGLCEIVNIGNSVDGRDILFAKISDNITSDENEPEFMYTGTMHGDETTGYVLMLRLIDYLLVNYGTDPQVTNLVDNVEIWINPSANPDGTYAGGNSSVSGATRYNSNGVDLNRNFPDPEDGPHPDGNAWQPETIAMMDLSDVHNFVLAANFHGGAEVINYPWDTWITRHADDDWYQEISHTYADTAQANSPAGYLDGFDDGITNGYDWYTTSGCRQDYMNYFQGCREVTMEISDTKLLPESQLDAHWNYNKDSFLHYMEECLYGVRGIVTDEFGNPLDALVSISGHDNNNSEVSTDPVLGNYHRMLYPGTYDITYSADGYETQTITGIAVLDNTTTIQNVYLEIPDITQSIELITGWNLNSLNVHPTDMTPETIFQPIETSLLQVKDLTETYDPSLPSYMNTLDELTDGYAYWINTDADVTLDVTAPPVDFLNTVIHLEAGWNLVGYVCQSTQIVEDALAGIMADVEQVKSLTQTYDPSLPSFMNTLDQMEPELGYWINVTSACDLTYPLPTETIYPIIIEIPEHLGWDIVVYPNNTAVLYGQVELNGVSADENDLIGAFVGDECRGVGNVTINQDQAFISIVINSAGDSEFVSFKYYDADEDNIIELDNVLEFSSGETLGSYPDELIFFNIFPTGIEENNIMNPTQLNLTNYPNPFNPTTTISFTLYTESTKNTEISIYNIKGQKIQVLPIILSGAEGVEQDYSVTWNGTDDKGRAVSSGVYMYQLKIGDKIVSTRNCLLLK